MDNLLLYKTINNDLGLKIKTMSGDFPIKYKTEDPPFSGIIMTINSGDDSQFILPLK
jgi:hypothetical protein